MSLQEAVSALIESLDKGGCEEAKQSIGSLINELIPPLELTEIHRALDRLRSKCCFELMRELSDEVLKVELESPLIKVRRQKAQALIELRFFDDAIAVLEELVRMPECANDSKELSEALGLLGRTFKQLFVRAGGSGEDLRSSIAYYEKGFELDPAWHGANLVALVARAERDGVEVHTKTAAEWADTLLLRLNSKPRIEWTPWDSASAAEAYLARGDYDNVAKFISAYWNAPNIDRFALAGTERQLHEIWQITADEHEPFLSSLLLHIKARQLTTVGGGCSCTADQMCRLAEQLEVAKAHPEALFGGCNAVPINRLLDLLQRARSVCRIQDRNEPRRGGTGFLIDGSQLTSHLDSGPFILTNHHVLHGDEEPRAVFDSPYYENSIEISHAEVVFRYWGGKHSGKKAVLEKIVGHSKCQELDFCVIAVKGAGLRAKKGLTLSQNPMPLKSRNFVNSAQRDKIFVVGHPRGDSLSFSLSDNEVVDHELDDRDAPPDHPRRIHYKAPTEPGSSGSPVLHHETLEVVGLHRSGNAPPLRTEWPRQGGQKGYEANEAISIRSIREHLERG